ncbi:tetratricopeptide repeat protein [Alteriqipengyuania sp. NZ-12B]|uniref:Tetratricopeptide repeat protein n=1 Tax=Alteriqipengyuania abyssalis TaxID=2860200 RepID=A0ABS7PDD9_9SPHN|nr:tetratricopeptide repeat protein [Alteriqipengyuania abyssalis]MBY8337098.1 tetratricopeptide repeat protein [Alteriqipengyuania abyssalis]
MGLNIEEQKAVERFQKEVVEPSMTKLVVLDFWAEWCGPCKALAPMLEKVAAQYADKGVVLKKINVDEEQFIASQFQVQSIPTVYAMFQGRPVADLTSARSESQLTQALDQILAQLPIDPNAAGADSDATNGMPEVEQLIAMGEQLLDAGETEKAVQLYTEIVTAAPPEIASRAEIQSGLIRALLANGQHDQAQAAFDALTDEQKADPAVAQAGAQLELSGEKVDEGELAALREKAQGGDMDARYAYAEAAFAARQRDAAADELLSMVEADREWNEGAARTKLLQIFEAVGLEDAWVVATRRRLSKILFG